MSNLKLRSYYATAVISLVFAVVGFSYNAWRMEVSEDNANIRTAAFEIYLRLSELEQIVFAAHYDKDAEAGNPRKGWVIVGLVDNLSSLISPDTAVRSGELKAVWQANWPHMVEDRGAANDILGAIDTMRTEMSRVIDGLE